MYSTIIDTNANGADTADEVLSESWADGVGRERMSRVNNPNSIGGWTGTFTEYDILGRVRRKTVPNEIDANWNPTGDDAIRGWLWASQEYDWKDRVIKEINTDGTDKLYTYEGCGCAGGQVTTIQSEFVPRNDQPTVNARRMQKVYADILGRNYKTQILNWVNSVDSTVVTNFNGRDQATSVTQYAGAETSSTFQVTSMTYDGHGRLKTEHLPIMDAGTVRTYEYQSDDQLIAKWDARGVKTNYQLDSLGRLQMIDHIAPENSLLPTTPVLTFGYDALGNRLWMQDGMGRMDYEYDELARLSAEKRTFNASLTDAPQSANGFRFLYSYHLSGALKNVVYPNGTVVDYNLDKTGRTESITGTIDSQAKTFLSNVDYRAWGATKKVDFGNGTIWEMTYNNRLLPDSEKFVGLAIVPGPSTGSNTLLDNRFTYYQDGKIKLIDNKATVYGGSEMEFDSRLNTYDHAGRIASERSSYEAMGTAQPTSFIKYSYDFTYDAFGHRKTDFTRKGFYINENPGPIKNYNFVNDRSMAGTFTLNGSWYGNIPAWQYDADGRPTRSDDGGNLRTTYNMGGYLTSQTLGANRTQDYWQDGNGNLLKVRDYVVDEGIIVRYSLRSSLIGEAMVFENTNSVRDRKQTYIYGLGKRIAVSNENTDSQVPTYLYKDIDFEFDTAFRQNIVKSQYQTSSPDQGANGTARIEYLSTQGLEMSSISPGSAGRSAGVRWNASGFASYSGGECTLDGIYEACNNVRRLIGYEGNGGAVQCPSGGCGPQGITFTRTSDGDSMSFLTTGFMAFANGISGNFYPTSLGLGTPQAQADFYGLARDLQAAGVTANQLNQLDRRNFSGGVSAKDNPNFIWSMIGEEAYVKRILDAAEFARDSKECAKAFEAIGATPIGEQINNTTIVTQNVFSDSRADANWAPSVGFANQLRDALAASTSWSRGVTTNDVTPIGEHSGRRFIGITNRGLKETDDWLEATVIHSFIHSGGIRGGQNWGEWFLWQRTNRTWGEWWNGKNPHDLRFLGKQYDEIIKHCTRKGESKLDKAEQ